MAPVIRISDDVFRRLQQFGEPLVDTPSSVIERVLAHYEATHQTDGQASTALPRVSEQSAPGLGHFGPPFSLFLVPTTRENLRASIQKAVPLQLARECLPADEFEGLARALAPAKGFQCWATNESNKSVFKSMRPGDSVLLTQKGTGKFNHRAVVRYKVISEPLAQRIWPVEAGLPWKYIYILDELRPIDAKKDCLVAALGYDRSFWVPGHIRVNPANLQKALEKYDNLERVLEACR